MNVPKLRFSEFEGAKAKRSELAVLAVPKGLQTGPFGSQLKAEEYVDDEIGIPVVMPRDIRSGLIVADKIARVDHDKADEMKRHRLKFGDVVFPRRGELGRIAVVGHDQVGWICGTGCLRFRPSLDLVDPSYLGISFSRERVVYWLESNAVGQTMLNLNTEILGGMPVLVPSLSEQKKIAAFLGVVDAKIAALRARRAGLERYKRGLMQALFSQTLRFTKPDGSAFPDWEEKRLGDLVDPINRYGFTGGPFGSDLKQSHYTEEGVMVIQLQNIGDGEFIEKPDRIIFTSEEDADRLRACNILAGDLLISKMGDPVARVCKVPDTYQRYVMCSDGIRFVVDEKRFNKEFVFQALNTPFFRKDAIEASIGSTRRRISLGDLKGLKLPIPHPDEQAKIAGALSAMDAKIAAVGDQVTQMEAFKKGLLQQMFV